MNYKLKIFIFNIFSQKMDKNADNIQVMVRIRPLNQREYNLNSIETIKMNENNEK